MGSGVFPGRRRIPRHCGDLRAMGACILAQRAAGNCADGEVIFRFLEADLIVEGMRVQIICMFTLTTLDISNENTNGTATYASQSAAAVPVNLPMFLIVFWIMLLVLGSSYQTLCRC